MTGIDGLRTLAGAWGVWAPGGEPKCDTSDTPDWEKPSCATTPDAADVTSDAQKVTREDREAIAWVREHGGIEAVKETWNRRSNLDRQLKSSKTKVESQQRHIEFVQGKCRERQRRIAALNKTVAEMRPRLLPEGMEWPTVDGKPVDFVTGYEPSLGVLEAVSIYSNGACEVMGHDGIIKDVKEIHIATPKVLDADGAEICEGDTVYEVGTGEQMWVCALPEQGAYQCVKLRLINGMFKTLDPCRFTHRAPVLAADGKPLREGETVWDVEDEKGYTHTVTSTELDGLGHVKTTREEPTPASVSIHPSRLTHERPDSWERIERDANASTCTYFGATTKDCEICGHVSWECSYDKARDLVRRAKALAGGA